jgi:hypothetical protein
MYNFVVFLVLILLLSCKENKEEVLNLDDITTNSDKYKEGKIQNNNESSTIDEIHKFSVLFLKWMDSLKYDKKNVHLLDTTIFNDRFGAKKSEKWYYLSEMDSLVFMHWEFKDSIKAQNSFYNWLDCFGKNCRSIMIGEEVNFMKRSLVFMLQTNHLFVIESSTKQNIESYINFFDAMNWAKNWKYLMNQDPRKKAKWFLRNLDAELISIKLNEF